MLSFLLDEHISPIVAQQIQQKQPEIVIFPLLTWQAGRYLGLPDDVILQVANEAQLTLVTYDQNTIPPLLWEWGTAQKDHSGVIFIDYQTIPPSNFGTLVRSLLKLWQQEKQHNWTNRLVYLKI